MEGGREGGGEGKENPYAAIEMNLMISGVRGVMGGGITIPCS